MINKIKTAILAEFQLKDRLNCSVECYLIKKRRFLVFETNNIITKENFCEVADKIVKSLDYGGIRGGINNCKSIIVVAYTNDSFRPWELILFNNKNTFVVYFLINKTTMEISYTKGILPQPFAFGLSCSPIIKRMDPVVRKVIREST